jgi:hypothetical protein
MSLSKEYILCAAIHIINGKKYVHQPKNIKHGFVISGRRHHNCFAIIDLFNISRKDYSITQGFLTNKDRFVDRIEAFNIAKEAKQMIKIHHKNLLFSEDLY